MRSVDWVTGRDGCLAEKRRGFGGAMGPRRNPPATSSDSKTRFADLVGCLLTQFLWQYGIRASRNKTPISEDSCPLSVLNARREDSPSVLLTGICYGGRSRRAASTLRSFGSRVGGCGRPARGGAGLCERRKGPGNFDATDTVGCPECTSRSSISRPLFLGRLVRRNSRNFALRPAASAQPAAVL